VRHRFSGTITGIGTTSGRRVVVGQWRSSAFGAFADVMTEDATGHRTLLAPTQEIADFVASTYWFDEVRVVPVLCAGTSVDAGPLSLTYAVGGRTLLGRLLALTPATPWFAALVDPVARIVLRGVRTRVRARKGDREWYAARDQRRVVEATVTWAGQDCGPLTDITPPVRFGPGSTPPHPSVVSVVSIVERTH